MLAAAGFQTQRAQRNRDAAADRAGKDFILCALCVSAAPALNMPATSSFLPHSLAVQQQHRRIMSAMQTGCEAGADYGFDASVTLPRDCDVPNATENPGVPSADLTETFKFTMREHQPFSRLRQGHPLRTLDGLP